MSNPGGHTPTPEESDEAVARLIRAAGEPLRAGMSDELRRRQVHAAAAVAAGRAPASTRAAARASRAPASRGSAFRGVLDGLRPVLAGGLALSLVVALVTAVAVERTGSEAPFDAAPLAEEPVEIAMEVGFEPSAVPLERTEEHVILTVDAARAELVASELEGILGGPAAVLSVRSDRTTFTVPVSAAALLSEPSAVDVVADAPVRTLQTPTRIEPTIQSPVPSWGLDRIDADVDRLDDRYAYISSGKGVRIYVIDTGVDAGHPDLAGRVADGWSAIEDGRGTADCNGHGTHVAGTAAGTEYGVAKSAVIVPVRVLDCSGAGFASSLIAGINWVVANHPGGAGIINLSVGGPANSAVDRAVEDAAARGLLVVAAAGNDGGDACAVSPARAASALTSGATTSNDVRASYSNTGGCVDLFAPGSGITSAWPGGSAATLSGTSMAAPHVAGIAARIYQAELTTSASKVRSLLLGSAVGGAVASADGGTNLLINLVESELLELDECDALIEELEEAAGPDGDVSEDELPEECRPFLDRERDRLAFPGRADAPGASRAPAFGGLPPGLGALPPGFGGTPPGLSGETPGQSGNAPGQSGTAPGQSGSQAARPGSQAARPDSRGARPDVRRSPRRIRHRNPIRRRNPRSSRTRPHRARTRPDASYPAGADVRDIAALRLMR
jgi:subtilisin family serine protease